MAAPPATGAPVSDPARWRPTNYPVAETVPVVPGAEFMSHARVQAEQELTLEKISFHPRATV